MLGVAAGYGGRNGAFGTRGFPPTDTRRITERGRRRGPGGPIIIAISGVIARGGDGYMIIKG